ncbi:exopolysaccharide biosynthesis protein [Lactobacillus sp. PV037]|uniref:YveK family protein n=1 Tax=Lactobacillus sp. PV037 TaxID=2594496 RepID=UPI00223EC543|nr:Wzz/FepE/Etk N-terminal domain-containing protein [Lactobacillus sp. PV037]QNQ83107.1 exopolysaccharide biosynthesis protein [Lactobacillus sp. PV037]
MEEKATQTNTIDLKYLWNLVKSNIWRIIIWTIGLGIIGFAVAAFVIPPKYSSSTQILVNQKKDRNDPNAAYTMQQANIQVINTYKDLITSPVVLKDASSYLANPVKVVKKAKKAVYRRNAAGNRVLVSKATPAVVERDGKSYEISSQKLQGMISVQTQQNSQVFTITAKANTPEKAQAVANAVANSFKKKITSVMDVNNVTIVSTANKGAKSFPNTKLFTAAGLVIGFLISFAIIIIRDAMNTTVRSDEYLTQDLGLTNLGTVTHFRLSNNFKVNGKDDKSKGKRV